MTRREMPDEVDMDDRMYRLYALDKIREGQEAAAREETISIRSLEKN